MAPILAGRSRAVSRPRRRDRQGRRIAQHRRTPFSGHREETTILGDNGVNEVEVAGDVLQIGKDAPGHQDRDDAAAPRVCDCLPHMRVQSAVTRDRPVVVEREDPELHRDTPRRAFSMVARNPKPGS